MRTYTYFVEHEIHDAEEGLETFAVYCGITTHYVEGDRYAAEYQTSFASKAEADAFIEALYSAHA